MSDELATPGESLDDGSAPVRVFMSYRRADDHHFIGRLHDRLCGAFGDDMVFRDIDSIPAGTNFRSVILRTLNEVDAVVAVIGPRWARGADGVDADYVYLELAEALKQSKPTIPVLMEETSMPASDALPADLRPLTEIQAISVHGDPAFRRDSSRLIDVIRDAVATDRARVAQQRRVAEEHAARADAERAERERLADQLRAEERAARLRLAELEEAAARRQIELESARLAAIAEQLRLAEAADAEPADAEAPTSVEQDHVDEPVAAVTPPAESVAAAAEQDAIDEPVAAVTPPVASVTASAAPSVTSRPTTEVGSEQLRLLGLIVVALVLGVVAMFVDRTYNGASFDELSSSWKLDVTAWIFALAVGVPLLLRRWPDPQQRVLVGVTVSTFFFAFLQGSAVLRYGADPYAGAPTRYDEGTWIAIRLVQSSCLVVACWTIRHRLDQPVRPSRSVRVALVATSAVCGSLLIAAIGEQWEQTSVLVDIGVVGGRTPLAVWLVLFALGPIVITVGLAARGSSRAQLTLATIATLSTVAYLSQTFVIDEVFDSDGSLWTWTAVAYIPLAAVAWSTGTAAARRGDPDRSLDAA